MPKYKDLLPDYAKRDNMANEDARTTYNPTNMTYAQFLGNGKGYTDTATRDPAVPGQVAPANEAQGFTFESWLADIRRQREEEATRQYAQKQAGLDDTYAAALQGAENNRKRAIADANNAAALRRSTYGVQGEQLGRNGLTLSGYGDYADQVAYATQRQEIANANNAYIQEKAQVDSTYASLMQQDAAQRQATIQKNDEDFITKFQEDPSVYTAEQIDALVSSGKISPEAGNAAKGWFAERDKARQTYVNGFEQALDAAAGTNPEELFDQLESVIEGDYNSTAIDEETRQMAFGALAARKARNVDESNYAAMKKLMNDLKEEGKLNSQGYLNALQEIEKGIGELNYLKTNIKATKSDDGKSLEVKLPSGRSVVLDQEAAMWDKTSRNNFKGIGNEMNEFLNAYVGEEPGMISSKGDEKRLFVRLEDGWYEVKQNVLTDLMDFIAAPIFGNVYEQDKIGTVKRNIWGK